MRKNIRKMYTYVAKNLITVAIYNDLFEVIYSDLLQEHSS